MSEFILNLSTKKELFEIYNQVNKEIYGYGTTELKIHFVDSKASGGDSFQSAPVSQNTAPAAAMPSFDSNDGFMPMPAADDDLPF